MMDFHVRAQGRGLIWLDIEKHVLAADDLAPHRKAVSGRYCFSREPKN
jgi:hypothetical protein